MVAAIARLTSEAMASAFDKAAAPYAVDDLLTTFEAGFALAEALAGSSRNAPLSYVTSTLNGHMTVWSAEEARANPAIANWVVDSLAACLMWALQTGANGGRPQFPDVFGATVCNSQAGYQARFTYLFVTPEGDSRLELIFGASLPLTFIEQRILGGELLMEIGRVSVQPEPEYGAQPAHAVQATVPTLPTVH